MDINPRNGSGLMFVEKVPLRRLTMDNFGSGRGDVDPSGSGEGHGQERETSPGGAFREAGKAAETAAMTPGIYNFTLRTIIPNRHAGSPWDCIALGDLSFACNKYQSLGEGRIGRGNGYRLTPRRHCSTPDRALVSMLYFRCLSQYQSMCISRELFFAQYHIVFFTTDVLHSAIPIDS